MCFFLRGSGNERIAVNGTASLFCSQHQITAKWNSKPEFTVRWPGMQSRFRDNQIVFGLN